MHHAFMHAHTPTHNLWLWLNRPPLAFYVAEMSGPKRPPLAFYVAEMSGPKRPRPKLCSHLTDVTLLKGLDEMRSFHFAGMRGVFKL